MRIQHNIAALNSYRNLTGNNNAVSKNLEKLSSGFRINRAGDDAAGLAISEKMRAQITGLNTAQKNAQDGVSLVQTAEGALTEVHSMLNRMVELADQSANGTYDNAVDRANLQKEMSSLKDEIDRIANATNFNGINLLDGSLAGGAGVKDVTGVNGATLTSTAATATTQETADKVGNLADKGTKKITVNYLDANGNKKSASVSVTGDTDTSTNAEKSAKKIADAFNAEGNDDFTVAMTSQGKLTFTSKVTGKNDFEILDVREEGTAKGMAVKTAGENEIVDLKFSVADNNKFTVDGKNFQIVKSGAKVDQGYIGIYTTDGKANTEDGAKMAIAQLKNYGIVGEVNATNDGITFEKVNATTAGGLTLQIGDTSDDFNQMKVSVGDMHSAALGIANVDVSTQAGAAKAVGALKNAINSVSSTRGDLGAIQNRLEHTINNLSVTAENMTAAESRIRDVDMANEMMAYTKNNILVQASQAMLAQANQLPQGVLQLLQ